MAVLVGVLVLVATTVAMLAVAWWGGGRSEEPDPATDRRLHLRPTAPPRRPRPRQRS